MPSDAVNAGEAGFEMLAYIKRLDAENARLRKALEEAPKPRFGQDELVDFAFQYRAWCLGPRAEALKKE